MMSGHVTVILFLLLPQTKNLPHGIISAKGMDLSQDTAAKESCPPPPLKDKTKPFEPIQSYEEDHKFYYTCMEGYVRKAGTSSLIRCRKNDKGKVMWDNIDEQTSLICIPDPKKTPEERGPEGRATSAVVEPKTTQMTTATTATREESTPGTTPFTTANTLTSPVEGAPPELTTAASHTTPKFTSVTSHASDILTAAISHAPPEVTSMTSYTPNKITMTLHVPPKLNNMTSPTPNKTTMTSHSPPKVTTMTSPTPNKTTMTSHTPPKVTTVTSHTPNKTDTTLQTPKNLTTTSHSPSKLSITASHSPFRLTTTASRTLSKLTTSQAKTFFRPPTLAVKPSSSATADDDNDKVGAKRQSRTISIGVSSTGVFLLIALLLAAAVMLKRRRGAAVLHVEQEEQLPMSSREGHQPQDVERYIPIAQYDH